MSNINHLVLYENDKKHEDEDLPTRGDVGAGYGKAVGSILATPLVGYPLGYYVGKHHIMEHPHKPMNKRSAGHRFGAMLNNSSKMKNILLKAGGAALGAAVGHSAGKHFTKDHFRKPINAAGGAAIGGAIGYNLAKHLVADGKDNRHLAKKLGYGRFGRAAASFTPFTGLFKPKKQQQEEEQDNK